MLDVSGVGRADGEVEFPELGPEIFLHRIQRGIAWRHRSGESPFRTTRDEFRLERIFQDVVADFGEGVAFAFVLAQNMVMGQVLKAMRSQGRAEVFTKELHAVALAGVEPQTHPDEVQMIGCLLLRLNFHLEYPLCFSLRI